MGGNRQNTPRFTRLPGDNPGNSDGPYLLRGLDNRNIVVPVWRSLVVPVYAVIIDFHDSPVRILRPQVVFTYQNLQRVKWLLDAGGTDEGLNGN